MKNRMIEIKWAVVFMISALLWMVLEKSLGWHDEFIADHAVYTNFFAIIAIAVYVLAFSDKKKNFYNGTMSYKEGFMSGVVITLIVTVFSPLTQYITSEFITPDYFTNVINYSVESGEATREEAEAYFNLKSYIIQATVGALILGLVTSAIVAIFFKSKK